MIHWLSGLRRRNSEGQKNEVPVKPDQQGGRGEEGEAEEDEYGGSTDEEPEEVRSTIASTLPSWGEMSDWIFFSSFALFF